jgi:hypothetical protein
MRRLCFRFPPAAIGAWVLVGSSSLEGGTRCGSRSPSPSTGPRAFAVGGGRPLSNTQTRFVRTAVVLTFMLVSGSPAWAQGRTDVVFLANDDRITGEILELDRSRLEFKTDDAGTIDFEWDNVVRIESTRQFEVSTSDGR